MINLLNIRGISTKAFYYKMLTGNNFLWEKFENFGRRLGLERKSLHLFINLISIVRYFESDFRNRNFSNESLKNVLDNYFFSYSAYLWLKIIQQNIFILILIKKFTVNFFEYEKRWTLRKN